MWLLLLVALALFFVYKSYKERQILQNLPDKYVLITGCDTGFGNLLVKQLDQRGMQVLAACLTEKAAEDLKKETSSRVRTTTLDVTDTESVSSAAKWVATIVGDKGLWGLVNNAGIGVPSGPSEWLTKDDFLKVLEVNLLGLIDVTIKMLPLIRKSKGRVVNVGSLAGRLTICGGGYAVSKYGVESFSDGLRREMQPFGVKVSIVEPGFFNTGITNPKTQIKNIQTLWERLPEETQKCYGEEYFKKNYKVVDSIEKICSTNLNLATDCMEHALIAVYPRTRYTAGWDAKLFLLPLSYFPAVVADFILNLGQLKPAQSI
ncbi:retinol dehydrogenase 7-like isoform X2 [Spea bombifrons]|nr:retinol dehydrogenase 7-like isoform X2 [Spea bombifrons]